MIRFPKLMAICLTTLLILTCDVFAIDNVTRKSDNKKFSGTIVDMSKNEFKVKKAIGEPDVIQANDVAAIELEGGGGELRLGYNEENNGRYDIAIERYTKAKDAAKSANANAKGEIEYALSRALGKQALADPAKQAAAIKQLQTTLKTYENHFRYYESLALLGRLQIAAADYAGARTTFGQLGKAPWNEAKMAARIAMGRILVAEGKLDEAVKEFEGTVSSATEAPTDQTRKFEAMLGQARALADQKKYEEALKLLDEVTDKGPAEESTLQADAYVVQGNALQALNRTKEAALAYLHVDILYPREAQPHAEALFHLGKVWIALQYPERSEGAIAKLRQSYPNSNWTKQLGAAPANTDTGTTTEEKPATEKTDDKSEK